MEPGGKSSFQTVKLQRPGRTTVSGHSARDVAAMVASNPILIVATLGTSICALLNSPYLRTTTHSEGHLPEAHCVTAVD